MATCSLVQSKDPELAQFLTLAMQTQVQHLECGEQPDIIQLFIVSSVFILHSSGAMPDYDQHIQ
jgi:hypothetical protein